MTDTLGSRLKRERLNKNLTQDQLATILSGDGIRINKSMLSKWENNREQPALDYLRRIAQYFQRSVDYFTGTEGVLFQSSREKADLTLAQAAHAARIPVKELEAFEAGASLEQEKKNRLQMLYILAPLVDFDSVDKDHFYLEDIMRLDHQKETPVTVPVLGKVTPGLPLLDEANISDHIPLSSALSPDDAAEIFAIRKTARTDDATTTETIYFIRQHADVPDGALAAVLLADPDGQPAEPFVCRVTRATEDLVLEEDGNVRVVKKDTATLLGLALVRQTNVRKEIF